MMYFVGLVIVSIAIGSLYTAPLGFMVLGGGLVIAGTVDSLIKYLNGPKK